MKIIKTLICYGLRHTVGEFAAETTDKAIEFLVARFTDESQALPKAIAAANERTWKALGVGLAGDGLWDQFKSYVAADGTDRAIRAQLEPFLRACALEFQQHSKEFRKTCLHELKRLRGSEALNSQLPAAELKQQLAAWKRYGDPKGVLDGACAAVVGVADALQPEYPNLAHLLRQRMGEGPPLLAALFSFFLRQEIAKNKELAAELTSDLLRTLYAAQEQAFADVGQALDALGNKLDTILDQLGRIEEKIDLLQTVMLDIQAEMQRSQHNGPDVRVLFIQIIERLDKLGMQRGVLSARHSLSIHSEDERDAVRGLLRQLRQLPTEQQRQVPALLNGLGKLLVGAGDFAEARRTFAEASLVAPDAAARAEIHYNAYRGALEQRDWPGALEAIRKAAQDDPVRFTLVPPHRYQMKSILGAGGFGTAFHCYDEHLEQDVVIKTLHEDVLECSIKDVFKEARTLRRLSHPAIIGGCDGEFADTVRKLRPYILMDYFPGITLRAYVEKHGALTPEQYVEVARQIVSGMVAAHRQGVWHRDLKPDNILVLREGERFRVKIIDFGLAMRRQLVQTSAAQTGAEPTVLARSGVGTLAYSGPEQMGRLAGVKPGPYSDVFAFGKTSWFALFNLESPASPNRRQLAKISGELADVLEKCVEYHPKDRHPDFEPVARHFDGGADQRKKLPAEGEKQMGQKAHPQKVEPPPPPAPPSAAEPSKNFTNALGMQFALAPPATFWMGDRGQQRQIQIPHHLYMGIHPVTQGQWQVVMGNNPSYFSRSGGGAEKVRGISDADLKQFPVEQVSWDDAKQFIKKLNAREPNNEWMYRLPTEAEWEYICRGGATSKDQCAFDYYFDQATNAITPRQANFNNSLGRTSKVGSYKPNALGVFDMHGNVWEWTADLYEGASAWVFRGGSWYFTGEYCRASYRGGSAPTFRRSNLGLRLARVPSGQ